MANKAIKYRIYPTTEQETLFAKTFGCCRKIYNLMLADKIASYKATGKFVAVTPAKYKSAYPFLKEVDSLALANKQMDLQKAFNNCFSKSRKKNTGFPTFKSAKHSRKSYTTNCQYPKPSNKVKQPTIRIDKNAIILPKAGSVKTVLHRLPAEDWLIKSVTVSKEPDDTYYASVLFEYADPVINYSVDLDNAIGLDYKSDGLYIDSNGNTPKAHKYYRESQERLTKAQRKLKHKVIGSNNYNKQQRRIAKIHRHIANQRLDLLQKKSTEIANQVDVVCVEDLNMRAMSNKGFGNGKATLDNGYGMFLNMLEYKLSERGKFLVRIDKWYPSSQICHCCGKRHPKMKDMSIRTMKCSCGLKMDRDHNAAINILNEGLKQLKKAA